MEQKIWLEKEIESDAFKKAVFRIALTHIPLFGRDQAHGTTHCRQLWAPLLNKAGIDLYISGHTHRYELIKPQTGIHDYPVLIGGAPIKGQSTLIRVNADSKILRAQMLKDDGTVLNSLTIEKDTAGKSSLKFLELEQKQE